MSSKQINQLPSGTANPESLVAADNADLTATQKIKLGDIAKLATSSDISYDNATSGLVATNVKAAIDLLAGTGATLGEKLGEATVEFHVAKNGMENATGSSTYPFSTIQEAVDYAEENVEGDLAYVVNVHPGFYPETVVLSRPRVHIRGTHSHNDMTMFSSVSKIEINCTLDMGGSNNTQYAVSGMLVAPASGDCVTVGGSVACTVVLKDCNLYAYNSGQKCLVSSNEASPKLKVNGVVFNNVLANAAGINFASGVLDLQRCFFYSGDAESIIFSGSALTMDGVLMQTSGSDVLSASGSGQISVSNCLFETSKANADGMSLSGTVTCTMVQNVFRVPNGSGYAVNGVAGCVLVHALNCYLPGYNNRIKSAMTAVAASTTPTSAV
jgi:hypothetical protein